LNPRLHWLNYPANRKNDQKANVNIDNLFAYKNYDQASGRRQTVFGGDRRVDHYAVIESMQSVAASPLAINVSPSSGLAGPVATPEYLDNLVPTVGVTSIRTESAIPKEDDEIDVRVVFMSGPVRSTRALSLRPMPFRDRDRQPPSLRS
jgi:hypothetical protein